MIPELVLLPGALGAASQFRELQLLLPASIKTHAIDFPLHGQNPVSAPFTIAHFSDHLIQTIETMKGSKVNVFGYSMGGYVAMYAAFLRPDLFEGVMTLATKMNWSESIAANEKRMLDPDTMLQKIPGFVEHLQKIHPHITWHDMVLNTASLMEDLGRKPLLTAECLQQISIKTRMGVGDHDNMVGIEESLSAYRQLPHGSFYVLPDTKHPYEKIDLQLLAFHIRQFLMPK